MKRKLGIILVLALLAALICAGGALALDKSGYKEHLREYPECRFNTNLCSNDDGHYYYCNRHEIYLSEIEPHYGGENNVTCTWKGACELCSHTYVDWLGHDYQNYVYNGDATCTRDGTETGKCIRCDVTDTRTAWNTRKPHTEKILPAVEPTCDRTGLTEGKSCEVCKTVLVEQRVLNSLGHEYSNYVYNGDATCTRDGTETGKCIRCDAMDTRTAFGTIKPHTEKILPAVAPTCDQAGLTEGKSCEICNKTLIEQQLVPATGHDYRTRTIEPTCTRGGYTETICANCKDARIDRRTASLGHWYGEWSQHSETTHTAECLRDCGKIGEAACRMLEYRLDDAVNAFCAVCGKNSTGERLAWIEDARIESDFLSQGEWIVRGNESWMTVGFEYAGELVQPETAIVRVPAALLDGKRVSYVNADGEQTELHVAFEGDEAVFALEFSAPAAILHIA